MGCDALATHVEHRHVLLSRESTPRAVIRDISSRPTRPVVAFRVESLPDDCVQCSLESV